MAMGAVPAAAVQKVCMLFEFILEGASDHY